MSAFLVSKTHVAALVRFAMRDIRSGGLRDNLPHDLDHLFPEQVAAMLYAENVKSVNARYPNDTPDEPCTFLPSEIDRAPLLSPVQAIKACHCLAYQSCEHAGWDTSNAKRILDRIESDATRSLPGYDDAAWDIEDGARTGSKLPAPLADVAARLDALIERNNPK